MPAPTGFHLQRLVADRAAGQPTTLIVTHPHDPTTLIARPNRINVRLLAVVFAFSLDRRLAAGCSPESNSLLAARAHQIVRPPYRRKLTTGWEQVIEVAVGSRVDRGRFVSVRTDQVLATEPQCRRMLEFLRSDHPVPAQAVAMSRLLLVDGAGPVYDPRSEPDLLTALEEVIRAFDPPKTVRGS